MGAHLSICRPGVAGCARLSGQADRDPIGISKGLCSRDHFSSTPCHPRVGAGRAGLRVRSSRPPGIAGAQEYPPVTVPSGTLVVAPTVEAGSRSRSAATPAERTSRSRSASTAPWSPRPPPTPPDTSRPHTTCPSARLPAATPSPPPAPSARSRRRCRCSRRRPAGRWPSRAPRHPDHAVGRRWPGGAGCRLRGGRPSPAGRRQRGLTNLAFIGSEAHVRSVSVAAGWRYAPERGAITVGLRDGTSPMRHSSDLVPNGPDQTYVWDFDQQEIDNPDPMACRRADLRGTRDCHRRFGPKMDYARWADRRSGLCTGESGDSARRGRFRGRRL